MPVTQTHKYVVAPGKTLITISEWAATLSPEDQHEFAIARKNQEELLAKHEAEGYIISRTADTIVYSDEVVNEAEKGNFEYVNPIWKSFFDRYQADVGIIYKPKISSS